MQSERAAGGAVDENRMSEGIAYLFIFTLYGHVVSFHLSTIPLYGRTFSGQ